MEPERKIEKLLRAYAKKRRAEAGDPLKLHPANRRLLLREAASTLRAGTATEDGRRAPVQAAPEASPRREPGEGSLFLLILAVLRRRLVFALCVIAIAFLGASMFLPALSSAKRKAQSVSAMNNLKELGMATRQYAEDNKDVLPVSLDVVANELGTRKLLMDPTTGKPFVYAGGGKKLVGLESNTVLAYSSADKNGRVVLFADGRVEIVTGARFAGLTNQKSLELALADISARERLVENPPAAAPVASATPVLAPPSAEKPEIALAGNESNASDLGMSARRAGEPAGQQPELAESEAKKLEPSAASAPTVATAGSFSGVGQTTSVNGSVSGKLAAIENSNALAQNRSFDRLTMQTNSVSAGFAASQNFVQAGVSSLQNLFKNNAASIQGTPVLQSFQMQQNGDAISVVDQDGSIYHGSVQPETGTARNEPAPAETFAARVAPPQAEGKVGQAAGNEQQAARNYFFRVAGMNQTLKQNVVFTGNVLANSGAPQTAQTSNSIEGVGGGGGGGGGAGNQLQQAAANSSQQWLLSNSRIVGTAVIASTNQIEINAVPVTQ